jgi:hypothetical protein
LDMDAYGDNVPFAVGSNQSIFKLDDAPFVPSETLD